MNNISVYLDNCCYNRPYDDQTQLRISLESQSKMYIQRLIIEKRLKLVYSFISEYENSKNPYEIRRTSINDFFKNAAVFVDGSHLQKVTELAREIMKTGIKQMDAYHVSSAIIGKADYFLTTDKRLLKYQTDNIKIINPVDFISIMEA